MLVSEKSSLDSDLCKSHPNSEPLVFAGFKKLKKIQWNFDSEITQPFPQYEAKIHSSNRSVFAPFESITT